MPSFPQNFPFAQRCRRRPPGLSLPPQSLTNGLRFEGSVAKLVLAIADSPPGLSVETKVAKAGSAKQPPPARVEIQTKVAKADSAKQPPPERVATQTKVAKAGSAKQPGLQPPPERVAADVKSSIANPVDADWKIRLQKRLLAVAMFKEKPVFMSPWRVGLGLGGEGIPTTPTPHNRTVRKRRWEQDMVEWKKWCRRVVVGERWRSLVCQAIVPAMIM